MREIALYQQKHGFKQFCPKAVLFDMDGVIYDSMPAHAHSWCESMASFGLRMPPEDTYRYEGMRGVETIQLLARQQWQRELSIEEAQRMYDVKSGIFAQQPQAGMIPGIRALMEQIKRDGLKICVVTGSGQHSLLDKLESDLPGLVCRDLVVTSFDVTRGKPDPQPYLTGMKKAGVQPWESIVVENAPLGVRAGVAAGCFTVAVNTGPLPDQALADEGADLVLPDMKTLLGLWPGLSAGADGMAR